MINSSKAKKKMLFFSASLFLNGGEIKFDLEKVDSLNGILNCKKGLNG